MGVTGLAPAESPAEGAIARLVAAGSVQTAAALTDPDLRPVADESLIPVHDAVRGLLPHGGLRRGTVVRVERSMSTLYALLARASGEGTWVAFVGLPHIGVLAARDAGVDPERLAVVPNPGDAWPEVTAALLDALDLVVLCPPPRMSATDSRRLDARVRDRKAVLLVYGQWPGAQIEITPSARHWHGISQGFGRLTGYDIELTSRGRGAAVRPRHVRLEVGTQPQVRAVAAVSATSTALTS